MERRLFAALTGATSFASALACGDTMMEAGPRPRDISIDLRASSERASDEDAPEGALEVLAEVHIDPFGVSFLATGAGPDASVSVATGANCLLLPCDRRDPVSRLRERYEPTYGTLTHLELFLALAPGVEPPAALVGNHSLEAFDAGRSDDEPLRLEPLVPELSGSDHGLLPITTIAELPVGGTLYRFEAAGVGPDAMVFLTGKPGPDGFGALTRLALAYGDLTLLETFLAFAPDAAPPAALVATHPTEIARMRTRDDDSVRTPLSLPPM
jgi:hypothetical protein